MHVDLPDAVVGQPGGGAADRAEVEAAVPSAGLAHLARAVALGEHHQAAAVALEQVDVRVHAPGGGGAERPRRASLGPLGGAGVVDHVVAEVLRQVFAAVDPLFQLGVGDVAGHDHRSAERQPGRDGVLPQLGEDVGHRPVQVDLHDVAAEVVGGHVGQEPGRVLLELLEEHPLARDPGQRLPVCRARDAQADRARGAVPRQPHDPHVVGEVLAPELGADADVAADVEQPPLHLEVAERPAVLVARRGQVVEVVGAGQLDGLQGELGRGPADDQGEVIGRAGGGADGPHPLFREGEERLRVEQSPGLLVEEGLVGRPAPLGDEQQLVLVAGLGVQLDLRRQVRPGVLLREHVERGHLRVAQVPPGVGVVHAPRQRLGVVGARHHVLALVPDDDGGARVLAARQHPAGRDVGVAQQLEGDEAVVLRRLGVVDDRTQLREMGRPQQVRDVVEGGAGHPAEHVGVDRQQLAAVDGDGGHAVGAQLAVRRVVGAPFEDGLIVEVGHGA